VYDFNIEVKGICLKVVWVKIRPTGGLSEHLNVL
jgi:hypothetical protein